MDYLEYLNSWEWKIKRESAIRRAKGKCRLCSRKNELNVHHLTYERFGHERDEDLLVVCTRCHNDIHFVERKNKLINFACNANQEIEIQLQVMIRQYEPITEDEFKQKAIIINVGN